MEKPILTKNDQEVLKNLLSQTRLSDAEIARKLRLSQQAIFKIRHKLEEKKIIEGYTPIINFKAIGITTLLILTIRVRQLVWESKTEEQISQRLREIPNVMVAMRIPESDATHHLIMGFKNIEQKDKVLMKMQTRFSKEIEIKSAFPCSVDRLITMSPIGLLNEMLEKKDPSYDRLFL